MSTALISTNFTRAMIQATCKNVCRIRQSQFQSQFRQLSTAQQQPFVDEEVDYTGTRNDSNSAMEMDVKVTQTASSSLSSSVSSTASSPASSHAIIQSSSSSEDTALVDSLLNYTSTLVEPSGSNIIAFSGGIDSSLAAALVHQVFHSHADYATHNHNNSNTGSVKAVIGVSSSLPQRQLDLARSIASHINIDLTEVPTNEGDDATYVANQGNACFVCKNHLYAALEAVSSTATQLSIQQNRQRQQQQQQNQQQNQNQTNSNTNDDRIGNVILFNGTNADDTKDPTRLGLLSAKSFSVQSPLIHITKNDVRRAAKHLNLPNWNYAASPCLRSRLAIGVEATDRHLKAVNQAEERVREVLALDESSNLRVRMLSGKRAIVELDRYFIDRRRLRHRIDNDIELDIDIDAGIDIDIDTNGNDNGGCNDIESILREQGFEEFCIELGFIGGIGVRAFKTGSVSTMSI